jgi:predicted transcriptional regulator
MNSGKHGFVMMIREEYWKEFLRKNHIGMQTLSYVRLGKAAPKETAAMLFYVVKPISAVSGYAEFVERIVDEPTTLWKEHGHESVLSSREQYEAFVRDAHQVSFIRFTNLREASKPIPLSNLLACLDKSGLPRKGFYTNKEDTDKLTLLME